MSEDAVRAFPSSIEFGTLESTHPEYDSGYWQKLRAFYAGGKELLQDPELMQIIFPPHMQEREDVYMERKHRAFYINYPGEILDHIVASLSSNPVQAEPTKPVESFYDVFFNDVSFPGGEKKPLNTHLTDQILTALQCGVAWTLVDLPPIIELFAQEELMSEEAQREMGGLDAYAISIDPESVFDWEETPSGEFVWVKTAVVHREHSFVGGSDILRIDYTIYRPDDWGKYSISYSEDNPPREKQPIQLVETGPHTFGRVPLLRLKLPDGLWAMNKLESIAREHFNKRNALAWAEYKSLFPQMYEFEDPDTLEDCDGGETGRSTTQVRGQGYIQTRAAGDRAEFIGPDSAPFSAALNSIKDLRDEMHRIMHQMALSFDNGPLALRRSGDSKAQDKRDAVVVLGALGKIVRDHAKLMYETISIGRGDDIEWSIGGMDKFDDIDKVETLEEAKELKEVIIPSNKFKTAFTFNVVRAVLKDTVDDETLEDIRGELESGFTKLEKQNDEALAQDSLTKAQPTGVVKPGVKSNA